MLFVRKRNRTYHFALVVRASAGIDVFSAAAGTQLRYNHGCGEDNERSGVDRELISCLLKYLEGKSYLAMIEE